MAIPARNAPRASRRDPYGLERDARGIWRCDFNPGTGRIRRSTGTADRKAATEWCAQVARDSWREARLGEAPAVTFDELVLDWLRVKERDGKRSIAEDRDKARVLLPHFTGRKIADIKGAECDAVLDRLAAEKAWANATTNRHRSFLTGILGHAHAKGWIAGVPHIARLKEPTKRVRWLTKEEAARLLAELPLHLARMARFALLTGLRQANVTGLRWSEVNLKTGTLTVHGDEAKAGRTLNVPLNAEAIAVLESARDCPTHGHRVFVFTYKGADILQPNGQAWFKALARAGIEDFRWHDLRHTWASWHIMAGTPPAVLKELGGWASLAMVEKYAHLAPGYTAGYAGNVGMGGSRGEPVALENAA